MENEVFVQLFFTTRRLNHKLNKIFLDYSNEPEFKRNISILNSLNDSKTNSKSK